MAEAHKAFLHQVDPSHAWEVWVAPTVGDPSEASAEVAAEKPGRLPSLDARTAALAELGYRPVDPAAEWTWLEMGPAYAPSLYAQLAVRPVQADSGPEEGTSA